MDGTQESECLLDPELDTIEEPAKKAGPVWQRTPTRLRFWQAFRKPTSLLTYLVKNRRMVLVSVVLLMILLEVLEHVLIREYGDRIHITYDVLLYMVFFPACTWLLLNQMREIESERERVRVDNDLHTEFSQKLGNAVTWEDLVSQMVIYPHKVAPLANITLYVFNPSSLRMLPEAACNRIGQVTLKPQVSTSPDTLPVGSLPQLLMQDRASLPPASIKAAVSPHAAAKGGESSLPSHRYDLLITRNEQQIGVIKLEYPLGSAPSPGEIRTLKSAAPVMALALEGALLQTLAAEQAAASEAQRQQVAQNLHDTLAQNISYLRLKLDQLTGENAIREIGAVLQELERMRATAEEAYQQVRNTLDELNPIQAENLASTLFKQARTISKRAGFSLRTSQAGAAHTLPTGTRQQILYIVREALYNIEKHAQARQVHLAFLWLETELIIKIADDGVGFDPLTVSADGHYGLWIMQQRAQDIGGTLKISQAEDGSETPGTEVTLWVPCPSVPVASAAPIASATSVTIASDVTLLTAITAAPAVTTAPAVTAAPPLATAAATAERPTAEDVCPEGSVVARRRHNQPVIGE